MPTVLITGANRGLGLEFAKQYVGAGWHVIACCRSPKRAQELRVLAGASGGGLSVHPLDVGQAESVSSLASALGKEPIDILLNNAGIYGDGRHDDLGRIDDSRWAETFSVNTMGPLRMAQALLENVAGSRRKIIACMSSKMGSISDNTSGGSYLYRSSKAALNAVVKSLSVDLKDRGIIVVALHPGWVQTDMGGPNAPTRPEESIRGLRKVLEDLTPADSGRFLAYDGSEVPW